MQVVKRANITPTPANSDPIAHPTPQSRRPLLGCARGIPLCDIVPPTVGRDAERQRSSGRQAVALPAQAQGATRTYFRADAKSVHLEPNHKPLDQSILRFIRTEPGVEDLPKPDLSTSPEPDTLYVV